MDLFDDQLGVLQGGIAAAADFHVDDQVKRTVRLFSGVDWLEPFDETRHDGLGDFLPIGGDFDRLVVIASFKDSLRGCAPQLGLVQVVSDEVQRDELHVGVVWQIVVPALADFVKDLLSLSVLVVVSVHEHGFLLLQNLQRLLEEGGFVLLGDVVVDHNAELVGEQMRQCQSRGGLPATDSGNGHEDES
ncbi:hypothetical protein WICPIJ_008509 [Wickerhamomyces pijperi]|uniref:Uncharacterized protein n=1 Tax=Wickerhamomyces pijperi TaxID=599730 RepID=A0A9P8PYW2_WICPI|nr:hypothetical protein WICPIJ_008509 [Wickerhamomyces pijperi]